MALLELEQFFILSGLYLVYTAVQVLRDPDHPHRIGSGLFWGLLALLFIAGPHLPPVVVGYIVTFMVALTALKQVGAKKAGSPDHAARHSAAVALGNRLLLPAIGIPVMVITGSWLFRRLRFDTWSLVDPAQATQVALGLATLVGLGLALRVCRSPVREPFIEGSRLIEILGWTLLLPQMLAALGGIFGQAGVGDVVADLVASILPVQLPLIAVIAYCAAMALFTMIMGNAFAAFPVVTLGIGIPFIVNTHGGNPAIMGALGMLSGYCGTLLTPMAANFNLVPALLLEIPDKNAVIRTQVPMAAAIWGFNVLTMYFCVYRF
jgi:uncharacterized membrane protein